MINVYLLLFNKDLLALTITAMLICVLPTINSIEAYYKLAMAGNCFFVAIISFCGCGAKKKL